MRNIHTTCGQFLLSATILAASSCSSVDPGANRALPQTAEPQTAEDVPGAPVMEPEAIASTGEEMIAEIVSEEPEIEQPIIEDFGQPIIEEVLVEETPQPAAPAIKAMGPWAAGDKIASGRPGVKDIEIIEVHANGSGDVCGSGKRATLRYVAMLAGGKVLDPGRRPFTFRVGSGQAIAGWDVVVAKMRVGDSLTLMLPQELAYGPSKGDLKFDMELLSFE